MPNYYPIDSLDTDVLIEPLYSHSQSSTSLANNGTISINNQFNLQQDPVIILTLNSISTSITLTNQTTLGTVTIAKTPGYAQGTIFTIYSDSVFVSNSEVSATFSVPFILKENATNIIQVSAGTDVTTDITVRWLQPSGVQTIVGYAQGFSVNENRTQKRKDVNLLNKYTSGYITQDISYDFSIDHLFFDSYFPDQDIDTIYRIKYYTDSSVDGIQQQSYYLCGVSINSWGLNQEEVEFAKEGVRGAACKIFKG